MDAKKLYDLIVALAHEAEAVPITETELSRLADTIGVACRTWQARLSTYRATHPQPNLFEDIEADVTMGR